MTPMLSQYFRVKEENPGCLLLFRVGDFYETYGGDAVTASRELDIVLTAKDAGDGEKVEMAGVPYFALDTYLHTLISKGYKVAIGEQVEDPKKARGIVKREVVRIVSTGTILDPEQLEKKAHNYLALLCCVREKIGLALADISTGDFDVTEFTAGNDDTVIEELDRWKPAELLMHHSMLSIPKLMAYVKGEKLPFSTLEELPDEGSGEDSLRTHFKLKTLIGIGIIEYKSALIAAAALLQYLKDTQKTSLLSLKVPRYFSQGDYVLIDSTSKKNLELLQTLAGREKKGTLLWALDQTATAMGGRLLRLWLLKPLLEKGEINRRLDAVEELMGAYQECQLISGYLKKIQDIERLLAKAIYGTCNGRDMVGLKNSLCMLPGIKGSLADFRSSLLSELAGLSDIGSLKNLLESAIAEDPPATLREGNLIRQGFNVDLDELRDMRRSAREWISRYEEKERQRTGIKSLKIGFNQVFGYYIEVTRSNLKMVPQDYIRKQTIANGERYFSPELKEYEVRILSADERIKNLEYELFMEVRKAVADESAALQKVSAELATLDVLISFAKNAVEQNYCRPVLTEEKILHIKEGRHPVIERILEEPFVKNDLLMDEKERMVIVTVPNMSGKSTYLRQIALIVIMAQMGSYVPARSAAIGLMDRIFTRVGATDDLHLGQSTFMVEMLETSNIINNATERSLVILDEIGRGTSTFDGLSIASAVAEYLFAEVRSKTLFATHFHELTSLSKTHPGIKNHRVAVKEADGEVVFLHRILSGASDKSYGIHVAKLAGFPAAILERAREILEAMENGRQAVIMHPGDRKPEPPKQLTLFEETENPILNEIKKLSIMEMTPIQALNKIYKWQKSIYKYMEGKKFTGH